MGKAEDQIDLIQLPGMPFKERSRIVMKNGLFYISNGNTGKVMEFNSYGDILTLYYNPEKILLRSCWIPGQRDRRFQTGRRSDIHSITSEK